MWLPWCLTSHKERKKRNWCLYSRTGIWSRVKSLRKYSPRSQRFRIVFVTLLLLPHGKIYDLPKIFCKQTTIPVLTLFSKECPCIMFTSKNVWFWPQPLSGFYVNQCGRFYWNADERRHRGCWLSQGDLENSTIGEWGISRVKVSCHQKTSRMSVVLQSNIFEAISSPQIYCFILHFLLLQRYLPRHAPLFYGEMLRLTCSFQSICLSLLSLSNFPPSSSSSGCGSQLNAAAFL